MGRQGSPACPCRPLSRCHSLPVCLSRCIRFDLRIACGLLPWPLDRPAQRWKLVGWRTMPILRCGAKCQLWRAGSSAQVRAHGPCNQSEGFVRVENRQDEKSKTTAGTTPHPEPPVILLELQRIKGAKSSACSESSSSVSADGASCKQNIRKAKGGGPSPPAADRIWHGGGFAAPRPCPVDEDSTRERKAMFFLSPSQEER